MLNPGTAPAGPPIDGIADTPYWTNRDVMRIESLPGSLVVIGGGAIGAELAQALARFGVRVTVLEMADRILAPEEPEASAVVADAFAHEGMQVLTGVTIDSVSYDDGRFRIARRRPGPRRREAARGRRTATQPGRPRPGLCRTGSPGPLHRGG